MSGMVSEVLILRLHKALDDGSLPNTISTDSCNQSVEGPLFDMLTTMSKKMMHIGISFEGVLRRSTVSRATIITRVPLLGSLGVDGPLLAVERREFPRIDSQKNSVIVRERVVCRKTICRGKVREVA